MLQLHHICHIYSEALNCILPKYYFCIYLGMGEQDKTHRSDCHGEGDI